MLYTQTQLELKYAIGYDALQQNNSNNNVGNWYDALEMNTTGNITPLQACFRSKYNWNITLL